MDKVKNRAGTVCRDGRKPTWLLLPWIQDSPPPCTFLKDHSDVTQYFNYCQQIPCKDQNLHCASLCLTSSPEPGGSYWRDEYVKIGHKYKVTFLAFIDD